MYRTHYWTYVAFFGWLLFATTVRADEPPANAKFTPPPVEESAEVRTLIDRAKSAFDSGRTVTEVLSDGTFMPVRAWPRFRGLVKGHAAAGPVTMVPASEPGDLLHVRGVVRDPAGRPISGALIYAYHTSARGWYSDKAAHISGDSGDFKYARLFVYLKSDDNGTFNLRTIRPAGYPDTDLPAHIHIHVDAPDRRATYGTEIRFDDDPRLTTAWRDRSKTEGCLISPVKPGPGKIQLVETDLRFR